ncbi:MAG: hypothetical protein CL875_06250 [Dehalococcoidales bacterium]|nr:hypothetical protein [Dehalococcoidales bacterium]
MFPNDIVGFEESVIQDQVLPHSTSDQFMEILRQLLASSWNDLILWSITNQLRGITLGYAPFFFLRTYAGNLQNGCYRWHVLTSGTQVCKAMQSLCYEIVLVNSNPSAIMPIQMWQTSSTQSFGG